MEVKGSILNTSNLYSCLSMIMLGRLGWVVRLGYYLTTYLFWPIYTYLVPTYLLIILGD
jgi:hypothetical protein